MRELAVQAANGTNTSTDIGSLDFADALAETLDALAQHLSKDGEPAKIVVWEHNSHIGDARATEVGQLGEWTLAGCLVAGVVLGLLNHLATEYWLLRLLTSGEEPTKNRLAMSTMIRLVVVSVAAVAIAVWFWPDGIGVFFGLAVFRLIALVMTTVPLLKELKKQ